MNIHIESTYPLWLVLPLVALAIFISWLLYFRRGSSPLLPGWVKIVLGITRALAIFLTGLLAISPWIRTHTNEGEKPLFIIARDNSRSMAPSDDSSEIAAAREMLIAKAEKALSGRFEVRQVLFGETTREGSAWTYADPVTQSDGLAEYFRNSHANGNLSGVLTITDGVVTRGPGFLGSFRNLRFPVYFLGTGDTLKKQDVSIAEVVTNDQVRSKSLFPVRVYYSVQGDMKGAAQIQVIHNNKTLVSKRIPEISTAAPFTDFEIESPAAGTMVLKVMIVPDKPDQNTDNNVRTVMVKVIGEEVHAVVVYAAAHPDIGALARAVAQTPQIGIKSYQAEKLIALPDTCDLLILHNLPSKKYPIPGLMEEAGRRSIPLLLIAGTQTDPLSLNQLGGGLSIVGFRREAEEIQPVVSTSFSGFILPEDLALQVAAWPPLEVAFESFNSAGNKEVLFTQKIRNIELTDPLILFSRFGGRKYGLIAGEGLWRWRMYDLMENGENQVFDDLLVRMVEYMVAESDDKRFELKFPGEITEYAPIRIRAILKNKSMEWINDPDVNLSLTDSLGHASSYQMGKTANFYELNLTGFPSGKYSYQAVTVLGDERLDEAGSILITPREMEQMNPVADFSGLRLVAGLTGGEFFKSGQEEELLNTLRSIRPDTERMVRKYKWYDLIDLKWILLVIALLLTLEWFLRRWFGTR